MSDFSAIPNLPQALLENIESLGYKTMSPIQALTLPLAVEGRDLIAQAKTGSGKTAAFSIPLLIKLNPRDFGTQALVMCPTRELCTQVADEIRRLARYQANIKIVTLCGGQPIGPQVGSLEHGAHVVVGTPGRIKDHLRKQTLSLTRVSTVVLDEADRMLDMGFLDDMDTILSETPYQRQTMLFSATFPKDIRELSARFQKNPEQLKVETKHSTENIAQHLYQCDRQQKFEMLVRILAHYQLPQTVVFCNTKQMTQNVADFLTQQQIQVVALHGDMEQRERDQSLVRFKQQSSSVLVATDVAARGLDIDNLPAVINLELPRDPDIFIHRIGRTGRAGHSGLAISLFSETEKSQMIRMFDHPDDMPAIQMARDLAEPTQAFPPPPYVTLEIAAGRKEKVRPGDILGAITGEAGIDGKKVGKINVMDFAAYVAIEQSEADKALGRLLNGKIKGRKFKVRKF